MLKKDVYNAQIKNTEDKIPDITNVSTNANPNVKINEVKNKIPSPIDLVTSIIAINAKKLG